MRRRAVTVVVLVIAVAAAVLAGAPTATATTRFTDVPATAPYAADIGRAGDRGGMPVTGPGRRSPAPPVTRQQMAGVLSRGGWGSNPTPACTAAS